MKATFLKGVFLGAVVSSVTVVASVALAGTGVGGVFNLGQSNTVNAPTLLTGVTKGQQLQVTNSSTGRGAAGIGINVASNKAPLVVNSSKQVKNLNADLLDGLDSSVLQQRVTGACLNGRAISSVGPSGAVGCTSSVVLPIAQSPSAGSVSIGFFPPSSLHVDTWCRTGGTFTAVDFWNGAASAATLNWMFSQGGTSSTVNATGDVIAPGNHLRFLFPEGRLEGQWIFSEPGAVTTVSLHAFDAGSGCEVRGTAQVALT